MWRDFADSYESLVIKQISPSEFVVSDDFDYNRIKHNKFASGYSQFHQPNFVQLPTGLVKPKKVSKVNFKFTPLQRDDEDEDEDSYQEQSQKPEASSKSQKIDIDSDSSSSSSSQSSSDEELVKVALQE